MIERKPPVRLWVFACPFPDVCPDPNGIHWCLRYDDLPSGVRPEAYDLDEVHGAPDGRGVFLYLYADMAGGGDGVWDSERAGSGAGAM